MAQDVTAWKSTTVTVIGGGNALAKHIPYLIFFCTKMLQSLMGLLSLDQLESYKNQGG